mmetsp:Transcript_3130/g.4520  ORF Transcript_3130/g.4520 Transcript_3130/m.4520 type:complete len:201 (-) Transcript_3130:407-1009(-)
MDHPIHECVSGYILIWHLQGQDLPGQHSKGVSIHCIAIGFAACIFWSHVSHGAGLSCHGVIHAVASRSFGLRHAKVSKNEAASGTQQDIFRLQVTVQQGVTFGCKALLVEICKSPCQLDAKAKPFSETRPSKNISPPAAAEKAPEVRFSAPHFFVQVAFQISSPEVFHHNERPGLVFCGAAFTQDVNTVRVRNFGKNCLL